MSLCPKCNHRPSMRGDRTYPTVTVLCPCPCHDAADAGPTLLIVAQDVLNESTGSVTNKRVWPIRAATYRALQAAIALAKEPMK